jgi:hypothetical protein
MQKLKNLTATVKVITMVFYVRMEVRLSMGEHRIELERGFVCN